MQVTLNRDGQQMGPYTVEQINEYLAEGTLLPTDYAWHEGLPDWVPVTEISGVTPAAAPPPFNPPQSKSVASEGSAKSKKLFLETFGRKFASKRNVLIGATVTSIVVVVALLIAVLGGPKNPPMPKYNDAKVQSLVDAFNKSNRAIAEHIESEIGKDWELDNLERKKDEAWGALKAAMRDEGEKMDNWFKSLVVCLNCGEELEKKGMSTCFNCSRNQREIFIEQNPPPAEAELLGN